jgi:hypothetical protein
MFIHDPDFFAILLADHHRRLVESINRDRRHTPRQRPRWRRRRP